MRLLDGRTPREICVALTYNLDLAWFETFVQPALRARGVRQIVIFADAARVSETLSIQGPILRHAGSWYQVVPVSVGGSFHPKALLTSGAEGATLHVGTGNLTSSGWGRNLEAFERWTVESKEKSIAPAFAAFHDFLHELVERIATPPKRVLDVLDEAFSFAPFDLTEHEESLTLIGATPPDRLLDRLPEPKSDATELRALAPYFDDAGSGVREVVRHLRANEPTIVTDARTSTLRGVALRRIEQAGGRLLVLDEEEVDRQLHAKVLHARGRDWSLGVVGSANLSRGGWLGSNVELAVLRQGAAAARVGELLDSLTLRELSTEDHDGWLAAPPDDDAAEPTGPSIRSARYEDDRTIHFEQDRPITRVEVHVAGRAVEVRELGHQQLTLRERGRGRGVTLVRAFASNVAGPWALVDDPAALAERAERGRPAAIALERLGLATEYDPYAIERFMALVTRLARDRTTPHDAPTTPAAGADTVQRTRVRRFTDADFEQEEESAARVEMRRRLRLAPTRLLEALLFGGDELSDASSDEGESGDAESEDAPEPSPGERPPKRSGTPERRKKFREIVAKMRETYLARNDLLAAGRGARRLFEDLLVLTAPLHLLLANADLDRLAFHREMVLVLRAFFGSPTSPIVNRLRTLDDDERQTLWGTTPIGLELCLLVYNTLLSTVGDREPREFPPAARRAVLWLGRLLVAAPDAELERLSERAERRLPSLQRGALWIAGDWPAHANLCPFPLFVERVVSATRQFEALSLALRQANDDGRCIPGLSLVPFRKGERDEATVLEIGATGEVVPGFAQWDEGLEVWFVTDLFSSPTPRGVEARMRRADPGRVHDVSEVERALGAEHAEALELVRFLA